MSTAVFEIEKPNYLSINLGEQSTVSTEATSPSAFLTQIMLGSLATQAVYVAATLGIADLLVDGPKSLEELARARNAHAPSLYRILRALASLGIFAEDDHRVFALTPTEIGRASCRERV